METIYKDMQEIVTKFEERYSSDKLPEVSEVADIAVIMMALQGKSGVKLPKATPIHTAAEELPATFDDFAALIERELDEAEQFIGYYKQAHTEEWKALAKYRTSGAKYFIDRAAALVTNPEQQQRVKDWNAMQGVLNNHLPR